MSPERLPRPELIRVFEQAGGVNFEFIKSVPEGYSPIEGEYVAKTMVRVKDVGYQIKRCRNAWNTEVGILFEYPGFHDGLRRKVRIIAAVDKSITKLQQVLQLTVVLRQEDYEDMLK